MLSLLGYQLRKFDDRLFYSRSAQIALIPLQPSIQPTHTQLKNLDHVLKLLISDQANISSDAKLSKFQLLSTASYNISERVNDPLLWELFLCLDTLGLEPRWKKSSNDVLPTDQQHPRIAFSHVVGDEIEFLWTTNDRNSTTGNSTTTATNTNTSSSSSNDAKKVILGNHVFIKST